MSGSFGRRALVPRGRAPTGSALPRGEEFRHQYSHRRRAPPGTDPWPPPRSFLQGRSRPRDRAHRALQPAVSLELPLARPALRGQFRRSPPLPGASGESNGRETGPRRAATPRHGACTPLAPVQPRVSMAVRGPEVSRDAAGAARPGGGGLCRRPSGASRPARSNSPRYRCAVKRQSNSVTSPKARRSLTSGKTTWPINRRKASAPPERTPAHECHPGQRPRPARHSAAAPRPDRRPRSPGRHSRDRPRRSARASAPPTRVLSPR